MKLRALILMTLSIACSAPAFAMSGPIYIDETCDTMKEAPATPALKAWFKSLCPRGEASSDPNCRDFGAFSRVVTANNENWRRKCAGAK